MDPQVSVVMPARDVAPWIQAAIRSVLQQSFADLELIVVDDGSRDATANIAASIADPRLKVLRQKPSGCSAARNSAVAASKGQYVGFLDADDLWTRQKLERHVAILEAHPEIDLTFSWSRIIDASGTSTRHLQRAPAGASGFRDILTRDIIGNGSCVVLRRSALEHAGAFDETLRAATDFDMWLRIAILRPQNCWCIPEPLTLYRRRPGQMTSDWRLSRSETDKVIRKLPAIHAGLIKRAQATNYRFYAFSAYESGECRTAIQLLARAFRFAPFFLLRDPGSWTLAAATGAKMLLPSRLWHRTSIL